MKIRHLLFLGLTFTAWFAGTSESRSQAAPQVAPPIMAVLYLEAQRVGTVEAWNSFLAICGDSPYCKLAEAERAKLAGLPKKPVAPPVAEIPAAKPEPAPVVEAPKTDPAPIAAQNAPASEIETIPPTAPAKPAAVPTPRPKPQLARPAEKPKPKPRTQPQPAPQQPVAQQTPTEPEFTGSIPSASSLPGTHPRRVQPIQQEKNPRRVEPTKQDAKPQSAETDFQPAQISGQKARSGGGAKSSRDFKRDMFRHLRTN